MTFKQKLRQKLEENGRSAGMLSWVGLWRIIGFLAIFAVIGAAQNPDVVPEVPEVIEPLATASRKVISQPALRPRRGRLAPCKRLVVNT